MRIASISCQNLAVTFYPEAVSKRFLSPTNAGGDDEAARGVSASFECGCFTELSVNVNAAEASIENAKFRTNGCGYMVAVGDILCDWLAGRSLTELHGLNDGELTEVIRSELGALPAGRDQCAAVVFDALRKAMAGERERRIEEFRGEKALICTCFGVSEDAIVDLIAGKGLRNVEQVAELCRAGSGCGSCRFLIQELIDMQAGGLA